MACLLANVSTWVGLPAQQSAGDMDIVLDRLGRYLIQYEAALTTVVADEHYVQREFRPPPRGRRTAGLNPGEAVNERTLDSDVAFLRLPGGATWFGVRDVRTVNRKPVTTSQQRLVELMKRLGRDDFENEAAKIVAGSAQYNLGMLRTINMPTTVLEVLHPDHHVQFIFRIRGKDTVDGTATTKLEFEEFDVPTLINGVDGTALFIKGTAWVESANGRLWRVELTVKPGKANRLVEGVENTLRVDFMHHAELDMLVPKEMREEFFVPRGRGTGRARYSNFRRFTTAARIVPPH
jgi:hypothetical protein